MSTPIDIFTYPENATPLELARYQVAVVKRFWSKVDKSGESGCWNWKGAVTTGGYGRFMPQHRKNAYPHRFSFEVSKGRIPQGMLVLHSCDNRLCCNPAHLSLGTPADNSADMVRKGRQAAGHRNGAYTKPHRRMSGAGHANAKLTASDVEQIRAIYSAGSVTQAELSRRFGVTQTNISTIVNGGSWK